MFKYRVNLRSWLGIIISIFFVISTIKVLGDDSLGNHCVSSQAKSKTINISAESLYWHPSETLDWAFVLTSTQNSVQSSFKTFSFDWAPGFLVGIGYNMDNRWDMKASYIWFKSKAEGHTNGPVTPAFLGARLSLLEPFITGKASLNLFYNMFDGNLGCKFFVSKYIFLRPSLGLKGGWINQDIHSNWTTPHFLDLFYISAKENLKHRFKGVGPNSGLTFQFYLRNTTRSSFSFIGRFEAGYLWGHWSIKDKFIDNFKTIIHINTSDRNFGSFVLHNFLGLGWDCSVGSNRGCFRLQIGYEIEDWLNQCQIFSDASGSQNNDLILQGFNFGLNLDF